VFRVTILVIVEVIIVGMDFCETSEKKEEG